MHVDSRRAARRRRVDERPGRLDEPGRLLPTLAAGFVTGLLAVVTAVSFAAMIFAGPLAAHLADGIRMLLVTGLVAGGVVAATSSYPGTVAMPVPRVAPVLALLAAAVAAALPDGVSPQTRLHTVLAALCGVSLLTGALLGALGLFRLGGFIRYFPYPVIGGVLAGTGWLLVLGAVDVMAGGARPGPAMAGGDALAVWGAGALTALALLGLRRHRHFLVLPGVLATTTALFYGCLRLAGVTVAEAGGTGWMIGPFADSGGATPRVWEAFAGAHWPAVVASPSSALTIALVSAVSVLLCAAALEIAAARPIRVNHELRAAGAANLAAGLAGGAVGFHSLSMSALALKMGAQGRLIGLVSAAVCAAVLAGGVGALAYLPRGVMGGLLLYMGASLLVDWLFDGWSSLSRGDYAVVVVIVATVALVGFLPGVAVGLLGAVGIFVVKYSRVSVVRQELTGAEQRSNVDRPVHHVRELRRRADDILILKLQGYLFFGTANRLLRRVQDRVSGATGPPPRLVVIDFQRVTGVDSSATLSFARMRQLAARLGFELVLTGADDRWRLGAGDADADGDAARVFADLDHGLEWCEDRLLGAEATRRLSGGWTLVCAELASLLPEEVSIDRLLAYMDRRDVAAGEEIIRQGSPADTLYFIDAGHFTAEHVLDDGRRFRLRKMTVGTSVGEVGIYLGGVRSASVTADCAGRVYALSRESLGRIEREDPRLAAAFHRWMARLMAERIVDATDALRTVLR